MRSLVLVLFLGLWTWPQTGRAAEPVKSGLQPGDKITAIFEPINLNGPFAGKENCLICEYGESPVAMVFAREPGEAVMKLLARLDEASLKHKDQELGAAAVFLIDGDKQREELAALAKKHDFRRLIVSTYSPAGPDGFRVSPEADVTVVLYRDFEVQANHAFRRGAFTEAGGNQVMADLPLVLAK